jgi:hypothetical protein
MYCVLLQDMVLQATALALLMRQTSSYRPEENSLNLDTKHALTSRRSTLSAQTTQTAPSTRTTDLGVPQFAGARRLRRNRNKRNNNNNNNNNSDDDFTATATGAIVLYAYFGGVAIVLSCSFVGCFDPDRPHGHMARTYRAARLHGLHGVSVAWGCVEDDELRWLRLHSGRGPGQSRDVEMLRSSAARDQDNDEDSESSSSLSATDSDADSYSCELDLDEDSDEDSNEDSAEVQAGETREACVRRLRAQQAAKEAAKEAQNSRAVEGAEAVEWRARTPGPPLHHDPGESEANWVWDVYLNAAGRDVYANAAAEMRSVAETKYAELLAAMGGTSAQKVRAAAEEAQRDLDGLSTQGPSTDAAAEAPPVRKGGAFGGGAAEGDGRDPGESTKKDEDQSGCTLM